MGLSAALNNSLSGLKVSQSQMEVVSTNIANVDSVGFTRRRLNVVQQLSGNTTTGVRVEGVTRQLEGQLQKQLRLETAGAAYTDVRAGYAEQLDQIFGAPGQAGSLDGIVNDFSSKLQALTANPADSTARTQVLTSAQTLATQLVSLSQDVQRMRAAAETQISAGVDRVNELIDHIKAVDIKLFSNGTVNSSSAGLLDERDKAIDELAGLVDIRTTTDPNGKISIFTTGGLQLYGGDGIKLAFDARGGIGANSLFTANPANRGVGTIRVDSATGFGLDVISGNLFRSGSIAAEIEMRDKVLVQAQTQLDDLAAALASALGDRDPTTPASTGASSGFDVKLDDLPSPGTLAMKAGNSLSIEVGTPTGIRRYQFIATDGTAPTPIPAAQGEGGATVIRFDRSGGFAGLQSAVSTALGPGFSASIVTLPGPPAVPNVLRVLDAGGGNSVNAVRAAFSVSGVTGEGPELPLFVDSGNQIYSGTLDGNLPQKQGFAARISVNQAVLNDHSRLVVYDTTPVTGTQQGDGTRPRLLLDRLTTAQRAFSAGSGIGDAANGYRSTVLDFARRVVETQADGAEQAKRIDEGQKIVLNTVQAKYSETSAVSIDQEMSDLVQIQNTYAANARVVSAVKELLDTLLRIGA